MNIPFSGRSFSNSGKRLLITFCLDVSPSMGSEILGKKSAITILNETVSGIVEELSKDKKLKSMVELMFVTFCTDLLHVERMPLNQFSHREFSEEPVGGSDIPNAVLSTFKLIDERIADYRKAGIRYHSPIFVLISDGNPDYEEADEIERNAMRMVNERCRSQGKPAQEDEDEGSLLVRAEQHAQQGHNGVPAQAQGARQLRQQDHQRQGGHHGGNIGAHGDDPSQQQDHHRKGGENAAQGDLTGTHFASSVIFSPSAERAMIRMGSR